MAKFEHWLKVRVFIYVIALIDVACTFSNQSFASSPASPPNVMVVAVLLIPVIVFAFIVAASANLLVYFGRKLFSLNKWSRHIDHSSFPFESPYTAIHFFSFVSISVGLGFLIPAIIHKDIFYILPCAMAGLTGVGLLWGFKNGMKSWLSEESSDRSRADQD